MDSPGRSRHPNKCFVAMKLQIMRKSSMGTGSEATAFGSDRQPRRWGAYGLCL